VLAAILADECTRLGIPSPAAGIRRLRVRKPEIQPFRLDQLQQLIDSIEPRWRDYILVWACTGLRTAELNGLQWARVDLQRGLIQVRETWAKGRAGTTKSESGTRDVKLGVPVIEALRRQHALTGGGSYVFTGAGGRPMDARNFARRIWTPLLRRLGLTVRRPYQLRHTYATLMLAAGENPEFIAKQLGHADTAMLFSTYSRYIPNLTRRDGSAFERLLAGAAGGTP
jgi:integrase